MIRMPVPPSGPITRAIISLVAIACLIVPIIASGIGSAGAETYIFQGTSTSTLHVVETSTIQVTGLNMNGITNGSGFVYNMTIPTSFSENGFSQAVSNVNLEMTTSPSGVSNSQTDMTDSFGNQYRQYTFNLDGFSGSTLYITVTATFDATITADATEENFTDPIGTSAYSQFTTPTSVIQSSDPSIINEKNTLLSGVTTEAAAVDKIMNFVKTQISYSAAQTDPSVNAVSSLTSNTGTCVNRAYLALALLRSAGIPARYVTGMVYNNPVTYNWYDGYSKVNWGTGLHAWVDVYYPQENAWVPYDPFMDKGFVDTRHIVSGFSVDGNPADIATHGSYNLAYSENVNSGINVVLSNSISVSGLNDNNDFQYINTNSAPQGQTMFARALWYVPYNVPSVTPTPYPDNNTTTSTTTVTPKPTTSATVSPVMVTGPDTSKYNLSGTIVDSTTGEPIGDATVALDAVQVNANSQGKFVFLYALSTGSDTLTTKAPGYAPEVQDILPDNASMDLTVDLTPIPDSSSATSSATATPTSPSPGVILSCTALIGAIALIGAAVLLWRRK
jgi:hypothetical protein